MRSVYLSVWLISVVAFSYAQEWEWVRTGTSSLCAQGDGITTDSNGYIYTIGGYEKTIRFNSSTTLSNYGGLYDDIFIVKYTPSGNLVWAKKAGSSGSDFGTEIKYKDGFIYLIGSISESGIMDTILLSDIPGMGLFFAKYTLDGNLVWVKQYGGDSSSVIPTDFYFHPSGDVAITGYYWGKFSAADDTFYSNGSTDFFVMLLDSLGNCKWAQSSGGYFSDYLRGVSMDSSGNVYAIGYFTYDILLDSVVLPSSNQAVLLTKFSNHGNLEWAEVIDGSWNNEGRVIAIMKEKLFIAGCYSYSINFDSIELDYVGGGDAFIARYDLNGNCEWAKAIQSGYIDNIYSLDPVDDDKMVFSGVFGDTLILDSDTLISYGGEDIVVGKFDFNGNLIWTTAAGGWASDHAFDLWADEFHNIYVTGDFYDVAHFGNIDASFKVECSDAFIAKLKDPDVGVDDEEFKENEILIFPNPASKSVVLKTNNSGQLSIMNLLGERFIVDLNVSSGNSRLDISDLTSGIYLVVLKTTDSYTSQKLMVE